MSNLKFSNIYLEVFYEPGLTNLLPLIHRFENYHEEDMEKMQDLWNYASVTLDMRPSIPSIYASDEAGNRVTGKGYIFYYFKGKRLLGECIETGMSVYGVLEHELQLNVEISELTLWQSEVSFDDINYFSQPCAGTCIDDWLEAQRNKWLVKH